MNILSGIIIPFIALLVSLATFIYMAIESKGKANSKYVETIEGRVQRLEQELRECQTESRRLLNENIELMRRLSHVKELRR